MDGARRLAEFAKEAGASRFIHVSHLAADLNSPSEFLRAKAEGEDAVRRTFPNATIVRPGSIYGHEDRLLNKMAGCLLYTSPSPRDRQKSRMPSSA